MGPNQPPTEWVTAALSVRVNQAGCELNHLPPSSTEFKNKWDYTLTSPYVFVACTGPNLFSVFIHKSVLFKM